MSQKAVGMADEEAGTRVLAFDLTCVAEGKRRKRWVIRYYCDAVNTWNTRRANLGKLMFFVLFCFNYCGIED